MTTEDTNELHASGEFYAAHIARFPCEWCKENVPFCVVMFSKEIGMMVSACSTCAEFLRKEGWKKV